MSYQERKPYVVSADSRENQEIEEYAVKFLAKKHRENFIQNRKKK